MTTGNAQVVQAAGDLHHPIRNALDREAQDLFDNSTAFDAGNPVFDHDTAPGEDPVEHPVASTQLLAFGLFFGCLVSTPSGS
jgi:hypothetical protein